jgi:tRNA threonylcarbamoyladenosine biosynthesis protein TsaE
MEITLNSTEETKELAKQIATTVAAGDIIALYGDLGSGKTTFTRYLVEALGIKDRVQSPTFIVHRIYKSNGLKVNHFDLYRLTTKEDILDMGFEETLKEAAITLVEWPQLIEDYFPKEKTKKMYFEYVDEDKRKVTIL